MDTHDQVRDDIGDAMMEIFTQLHRGLAKKAKDLIDRSNNEQTNETEGDEEKNISDDKERAEGPKEKPERIGIEDGGRSEQKLLGEKSEKHELQPLLKDINEQELSQQAQQLRSYMMRNPEIAKQLIYNYAQESLEKNNQEFEGKKQEIVKEINVTNDHINPKTFKGLEQKEKLGNLKEKLGEKIQSMDLLNNKDGRTRESNKSQENEQSSAKNKKENKKELENEMEK